MSREDGRIALDLDRRAWEHQRGDLTLIGTWWMGDHDDEVEPCIVLVPTVTAVHQGWKPAVVLLSGAWIWRAEKGKGDPIQAARIATRFLERLCMTPTLRNAWALGQAIQDHLDDLVKMPPVPGMGRIILADAVLTDEHGKQHTSVITRLQ